MRSPRVKRWKAIYAPETSSPSVAPFPEPWVVRIPTTDMRKITHARRRTPRRGVTLLNKAGHPSLPTIVAHATDSLITEGAIASLPIDVDLVVQNDHVSDASATLRCELDD